MDTPKISIVTINLNGARCLEKAISSVLFQTYSNLEYILIDGGSTDGSLEIIKKYNDKITHWTSEPDAGISEAFNKGISYATGEWVGILNSDDWYQFDAVENVARCAQKHPRAEVIHGNMQIWNGDKKEMYLLPDQNLENIKTEMILNHPACFVKKSVYQNYGVFNIQYLQAMDYELFLRFYKNHAQFFYLDLWISNMRLGGSSDRYWYRATQEVLRAQLYHNGFNFSFYLIFIFRLLRTGLRVIFKKIGFNAVVIFCRNCQKRKHC